METTLKQIQSKGITETGLKWIALVTMVMDHIHYFFGFTGHGYTGAVKPPVRRTGNRESGHKETDI